MHVRRSAGFTYIGLLVLIAVLGLGLARAAGVWQTAQQRAKEEDLLFVGNQFKRAIRAYLIDTGHYPQRLEDLLKDPGFPGVRRYLRRMYRDPMTGRAEWGLVKIDGNSVAGVYSLSDGVPLKQGGFSHRDRDLAGKTRYREWEFIAQLPALAPAAETQGATTPSAAPVAAGGGSESGPTSNFGSNAVGEGTAALGRLGSRVRR